jgi:hypothetical protein
LFVFVRGIQNFPLSDAEALLYTTSTRFFTYMFCCSLSLCLHAFVCRQIGRLLFIVFELLQRAIFDWSLWPCAKSSVMIRLRWMFCGCKKRERERVVGHSWHDGDSCEIQQLRQTSPGCLAATRDSSSYPSVFHSWIHSFFLLCSRWTSLCREGEIMMRAVSLCVSWTFRHCCGSLLDIQLSGMKKNLEKTFVAKEFFLGLTFLLNSQNEYS